MPFWFAAGLIALLGSLTWLLDHPAWGMGISIVAAAGAWGTRTLWVKPILNPAPEPKSAISPPQIEQQLQASENLLTTLAQYQPTDNFSCQLQALRQQIQRQQLEIILWGQIGSGQTLLKTQLQPLLPSDCHLEISETLSTLPAADLIGFVMTGDLSESEFQALTHLKATGSRFLVIWPQPPLARIGERGILEQTLSRKLAPLVSRSDWVILRPGEVNALVLRLDTILKTEKQALIWQRTLHQAQALHHSIHTHLHQARRELALPIINRYQWLGAGVAAVNPIPILDLVVAGGLFVKLTWELGQLYQENFTLNQARPLAETLLRGLVQFGAVEVTTQTLTHWLKGNTLTYLAGSCVQGASLAYLIRVAGLSLIDYWQNMATQSQTPTNVNLPKQLQASIAKTLTQFPRAAFFRSWQPQA